MGARDISRDLDKLECQVDGLERDMEPLLLHMERMSSQLPLLDRAKLMSLAAYSIEASLFCTYQTPTTLSASHIDCSDALAAASKLRGPDSVNVNNELKRVHAYFVKIKSAESPVAPPAKSSVDTEVAARILKHSLGGDKALKEKLDEQVAKERAKTSVKRAGNKRPGPTFNKDDETAKKPRKSLK